MTLSPPITNAYRGDRTVPPFGGFNLPFLWIEVRRRMRNRRTLIFTIVMPIGLFLLVGYPYLHTPLGNTGSSVAAYIMISMAVYGAIVASASAGGAVALERSVGWSRQLRLTPLHPAAYIATKVVSGLVVGLVAVAGTFGFAAIVGVRMPVQVWILSGFVAWLGSLIFTALGLFLGYLVPSENVMQFLGPILAVLALLGGLFSPLNSFPEAVRTLARFTPIYGLGELARSPLTGGAFDWWAVLNALSWLALFSVGAMLMFRRDTKRV